MRIRKPRTAAERKFSADGCKQHEIEPGRSVVNDWDKALFEPWAERKARRQSAAKP